MMEKDEKEPVSESVIVDTDKRAIKLVFIESDNTGIKKGTSHMVRCNITQLDLLRIMNALKRIQNSYLYEKIRNFIEERDYVDSINTDFNRQPLPRKRIRAFESSF